MRNNSSSFFNDIKINEDNNTQILIHKLRKHIINVEDLTENQRLVVCDILKKEISKKKKRIKNKTNKIFVKRLKESNNREEVFGIMSDEDKKNMLEYLNELSNK